LEDRSSSEEDENLENVALSKRRKLSENKGCKSVDVVERGKENARPVKRILEEWSVKGYIKKKNAPKAGSGGGLFTRMQEEMCSDSEQPAEGSSESRQQTGSSSESRQQVGDSSESGQRAGGSSESRQGAGGKKRSRKEPLIRGYDLEEYPALSYVAVVYEGDWYPAQVLDKAVEPEAEDSEDYIFVTFMEKSKSGKRNKNK